MRNLIVTLTLALVLVACGDSILLHQEGGREYIVQGEQRMAPEWPQWRAWEFVSACTGIAEPSPAQVVWWKVDLIVEQPTGVRKAGLANLTRGHIYIAREWWDDWRISGAELLHLKLGPGIREGHPEYDACTPMSLPPEE